MLFSQINDLLLGAVTAILFAGYVWMPAFLSNMAALLGRYVPIAPLDGGWMHRDGNRMLGETKSWGGLVLGTLIGYLGSLLLYKFIGDFGGFREVASGFTKVEQHIMILALAFGALLGDAVKSYFKRRRCMKSGESWFLWDKLDLLLGSASVGGLVYVLLAVNRLQLESVTKLNILACIGAAILAVSLTGPVCRLGHFIGLKKTLH